MSELNVTTCTFKDFEFLLYMGTSLVVQWLRLQAPNSGAQVRSLVRELDPICYNLRSCMPQRRLKIPQAATKTQNRQMNKLIH